MSNEDHKFRVNGKEYSFKLPEDNEENEWIVQQWLSMIEATKQQQESNENVVVKIGPYLLTNPVLTNVNLPEGKSTSEIIQEINIKCKTIKRLDK